MTSAQYASMPRQAHIRLKKELAVLRRRPSIEVPDDYIETHEDLTGYRTRRARIRHIEDLLADAVVDEDSAREDVAEPGMFLTVRFDDTDSIKTFHLGGHGAGDNDNDIYPLRSPIGRAIAGARPGDQRTFSLPGETVTVTLLNAKPAANYASKTPRPQRDPLRRNGDRHQLWPSSNRRGRKAQKQTSTLWHSRRHARSQTTDVHERLK